MDEGSSATMIKKAIEHVYKPVDELTYFKNIISAFYLQGTDSEVVEKILIGLYNQLPSHEIQLAEIIKLLDDIYTGDEKPNSGTMTIDTTYALWYFEFPQDINLLNGSQGKHRRDH